MTDISLGVDIYAPALEPPEGVVSDFDSPPNKNAYGHATVIVVIVISTLAVAGRILSRWYFLKKPHIGDYILILAYGVYIATAAWVYRIIGTIGFLVDQWNVRAVDLAPFLHLTFVVSNIWSVFVPLIKVAICMEWLHLFSPKGTRGFVFWSSHFIIWTNILTYFICIVLLNIACVPYERNWNKLVPGTCGRADTARNTLVTSIINVATDIMIFIIPQKTIWNLNMSKRKRLGVSIIFAIGIFACAAAILRLVFSVQRNGSANFTHSFSAVIATSLAEGICGILVMCIPSFPKAYSGMNIPKLVTSLRSWSSMARLRGKNSRKTSTSSAVPSSGKAQYLGLNGNTVPLYEIRATGSNLKGSQTDEIHLTESGIVQTTDFESREDYSTAATTDEHYRQHPWTNTH
ncbi:hypothetical protein F4818DRAFT_427460 [Hypoxylon cercidicola]|nr:hypothetical protein F4818DRAFT_427460 [Hypoxylon cercidicola]